MQAHLLAQVLQLAESERAAGRPSQAEDLCRRLLDEMPDCADAWNLMALLYADAGRDLQAAACLERAMQAAPRHPGYPANLGELMRRAGLPERAVELGTRAVQLDPRHLVAHLNLGFALLDLGRAEQALAHFAAVTAAQPSQPQAWFGTGRAHLMLQRIAPACEALEHCQRLAPGDPEGRLALAQARRLLGDRAAAQEHLQVAARALPGHPGVVALQADLLLEAGRLDAAEQLVRAHVVPGQPAAPGLLYRLSLCRMSRGDYRDGFALYESRLSLGPADVSNRIRQPVLPMPLWQGQDLRGKRVLVLTEQGYGDHIQFCRFVPRLAALGAEVVMGVAPPLEGLMRSLPGCSQVLTQLDDTRNAGCDYWVFVGSLAQRLQIDRAQLDTGGPYLRARDDLRVRWRELLERRVGPGRSVGTGGSAKRVGLVWGGRPENEYERRRALPFEALLPLGQVDGVRLVSLQLGPRAQDLQRHPGALPIEVLTPQELGTFEDTAALMAELDAVVTIDTAFSHLAGALGVPTLLLLPEAPDWRWWLQPETSPWYPSVRLFRQASAPRWDDAVGRVARALSLL
jgi:tetratricopeptide (TPR) repeat protein